MHYYNDTTPISQRRNKQSTVNVHSPFAKTQNRPGSSQQHGLALRCSRSSRPLPPRELFSHALRQVRQTAPFYQGFLEKAGRGFTETHRPTRM